MNRFANPSLTNWISYLHGSVVDEMNDNYLNKRCRMTLHV